MYKWTRGRGFANGIAVAIVTAVSLVTAVQSEAQSILTDPERTITISRGMSALITPDAPLERVSIADPEIAEAVPLSPTEILINAKTVGSTSLVVWAQGGVPRLFAIEVSADVAGLQRQLDELFPGAGLSLSIQGSTVILSGQARDPSVARRALEIAGSAGVAVINNITAPFPQQILLHVQFAEVNLSATSRLGGDVLAINPQRLGDAFDDLDNFAITESSQEGLNGNIEGDFLGIQTLAQGIVQFAVFGQGTQFETTLRALKSTGNFKSLAEPNLMAIEGKEASFLAGGEFPYPTIQSGDNSNRVVVTFKEFGIRLRFTPEITNTGSIRLAVAPEVSSLDFANGLTLDGFAIPSLQTRRVETEVDLRPGEMLAIGGLLDNSILENVDKIPLLGDIPIIGTFFRDKNVRKRHTELLVIVTPYLVQPSREPIGTPTGEPDDWDDWDAFRRKGTRPGPDGAVHPDGVVTPPDTTGTGGLN